MNKYKGWIFGLIILIILFAISQFNQNSLSSKSDQVFSIERDDIFGIEIHELSDSISLSFNGDTWSIDGHDSLTVKENTINSFFEKILDLKRTTLISKNSSKWDKFMVGDSTGTHLIFLDYNNESIGKIIVGRSNAEWSSSNVRIENEVEVYQTNENISWQLNTSPTHWGEVPTPAEPAFLLIYSINLIGLIDFPSTATGLPFSNLILR